MGGLKADRPEPDYVCGQQDLYSVGDTVVKSYADHESEFAAYNTKFTSTTGTDLKAAIKAARNLPGEAQRDSEHSVIRTEMLQLRDECLINWQQLETCIVEAFDEDVVEDKLVAAGHGFYASAQNNDWDDVNGLMSFSDGASLSTCAVGFWSKIGKISDRKPCEGGHFRQSCHLQNTPSLLRIGEEGYNTGAHIITLEGDSEYLYSGRWWCNDFSLGLR